MLEQSLTEVYLRSRGQWCKVYLECYRSVKAEGCSLSTGRGRKGSWISSVLHTGVYQGSVPWRSVPGGSVYNVQMYSLSKVRGGAVPIDLGGESETLISYNVFLTNFFQF